MIQIKLLFWQAFKMGFESPTRAAKLQRQTQRITYPLPSIPRRTLVEKEQLEQGNYVIASKKPAIISPLGAIPKDDGSVRLIHDGSLREGFAMNEYTDHHSVRYQTLQDACRLAKPGYYCAKLDLQSAYRSVFWHPPWRLQCHRVSMALWRRGHWHVPVWCSVTIRFGLWAIGFQSVLQCY